MKLTKADSTEPPRRCGMMDPVTVRTGAKRFDGEAHSVAFSVYVRKNGEVKLWVKRRMRLKGGPQTMFGSDFANVELEPTDE
jgi:hypothetical protein